MVTPAVSTAIEFDPLTSVFDPKLPEVARNPYPWFDRLRELDPVHRGVGEIWFLTRFADVDRLLRDHKTFIRGSYSEVLDRNFGPNSLNEVMGKFIFALDPPDHTRLRRLVARSFTREKAELLRPRMKQVAESLLNDALAQGDVLDIIEQFAYPLPLQIVCEILGVPSEDRQMLRSWTNTITPTVEFVISDEVKSSGIEAAALFKGYFTALISERRKHRQNDLISELLDAGEDGERLTDTEMISLCTVLLIAGHENVTNLVGNGILALLHHPDELARVQRDLRLCTAVVTETLRYDSPVTYVPRDAAVRTQIGDIDIAPDDTLVALFGAANRDPRKFPNPNVFQLERPDGADHVDFGRGIAYCLGASFAVVEGEVAFETLISRLGRFSLAVDESQLEWRPTIWARGLQQLPIKSKPR
jgi:cytochrome P450